MEKARDNTGMGFEKSQSEKEVIMEVQRDNMRVHFASLMDIYHLKNAEPEPKLQKWKGRVVLREDVVKDDSEAHENRAHLRRR